MEQGYNKTLVSCFIGYISQAIVNNFAPLLFLTFQASYGVPLSQITLLITLNFTLQLFIDLVSPRFIDHIGYRASAMLAHVLCAVGLAALAVLPHLLTQPFMGLCIAVCIYATGGGLIEVLISPIVEACPTPNKAKAMSLLHSFYCWGHVGVVLLSTLFFFTAGTKNWPVLALLWALIPAANVLLFARVPIAPLLAEGEEQVPVKQLLTNKLFWLMLLLMVCAGASEQSVSQWASTFAEKGLGISKTMGDLAGPMMFAVFMGLARVFYGKFGEKIKLKKFMMLSALLCVGSYFIISFSPWPLLGLVGCALCGLSVGILWPGTFSLASRGIRGGGTAMFAYLALGGDAGCSLGPTLVGFVSGLAGDSLKAGILAAVVFPLALLAGVALLRKKGRKAAVKGGA